MASTRAAIRYAKAILEIAQEKGTSQEVGTDMLLIASTIQSNEELSNFVESPIIGAENKEAALLEVFASSDATTKSLFHLLAVNKRFGILETIALEYKKLLDEVNNVEIAEVITAFPLTYDLEAKVLAKVKEFTTKTVTLQNTVDESIIGGFILRIGDKQFNASVANSLHVLKRELSN
ncbi:ATP synthase F1 subunit delta [Flavobacterium sp. SM2513]|uniref:ATP synthase F1 subunit delta n=1 Tax=Flavobacterium sp. SM2513 TaxID=3424766 RepID=UPI003D7FD944